MIYEVLDKKEGFGLSELKLAYENTAEDFLKKTEILSIDNKLASIKHASYSDINELKSTFKSIPRLTFEIVSKNVYSIYELIL